MNLLSISSSFLSFDLSIINISGDSFKLTNSKGEVYILTPQNSDFHLIPLRARNDIDLKKINTPSNDIKILPSNENLPIYGTGTDNEGLSGLNIFNFPFENSPHSLTRNIITKYCISSGYHIASSNSNNADFLTTIDIRNRLVRHIPLKVFIYYYTNFI